MTALTDDRRLAATLRRNALAVLPAPLIAGAALAALAWPPLGVPALLGAAGWLLALAARQPVALLVARRTTPARGAAIIGWCSGPAEELVRLALVLLALRSFEDAIWAGFGWATIEVLLVLGNGFAMAALIAKDDAKSLEARALLEAQGLLAQHHAGWGLLERLSATALHTGFTLLLLAQPWLVLLTLAAHSVINMLMVRIGRTRLAVAEIAFAIVSAAVLAAGILLATA